MSQHNMKLKTEGISDPDALRRFEIKLQEKYKIKKLSLPSASHVFRTEFCLDCSPEIPVSLQVWSSNTILIQGSPKISKRGFTTETRIIMELAKSSLDATPDPDLTPYMIRARTLFAYINRLNLGDEIERMTAVSIGDIVLDLLLCHKISLFGLPRKDSEALMDLYIPNKIDAIKKKETVYREEEIKKVHILRNRIAHGGSLITEDEAGWAKDIIEDIIENI